MKLTQTPSVKSSKGMTLLELTVVILVLLSLISILFIGARAWKKGSDRAANIMNIRNVQQAVRSEANMKALNIGDALVAGTSIWGANLYMAAQPKHPVANSTYKNLAVVPAVGTLYMTTDTLGANSGFASAAEVDPASTTTTDW